MLRQALPLFFTAVVLLILFGVAPAWWVYLALPLAALSTAALTLAGWNRGTHWRWAALGSLLWTVEESIWAVVRFGLLPETVGLTDVFYFSGSAAWAVALLTLPKLSLPYRNLLLGLPVFAFLVWLLWQNASLTLILQFPIVELVLFALALPSIESAFWGRAHEGRILWGFGFFVRALATALYVWLSPDPVVTHSFFLLSVFGYTFIGLGVWLELSEQDRGILAATYTVVALETVIGIVLMMFYQTHAASALVLGVSAGILGYILFIGVMLHLIADRNRRLRAEAELRRYSALLERLLSFETKTDQPQALLAEVLSMLQTFFPTLSGLVVDQAVPLWVGKTVGHAFPLVANGGVLGQLYFSEPPQAQRVLDGLAPLLASRIQTTFSHAELQQHVRLDPLTGLLNRRGLEEKSAALLASARLEREALSVALLDLDHFKRVNDHYGHDVGDAALVALAGSLKRATRSHDLVVRWGGEEFLVVLFGSSLSETREVVMRIQNELRKQPLPPIGWPLTFSGGLAGGSVPDELTSLAALISVADRALLRAKAQGRDRLETAVA